MSKKQSYYVVKGLTIPAYSIAYIIEIYRSKKAATKKATEITKTCRKHFIEIESGVKLVGALVQKMKFAD